MRKIIFGIVITLVLVFGVRYCDDQRDSREQREFHATMIQEQLKNVGKLVVTEANYSEVFSYADSKKFYFDMFSSDKKVLVIVDAQASISYDLSKVKTKIDTENKTLIITYIPEPELAINPNIEYYDIEQDYLNQFNATDYNKIKERVEGSLYEKIEKSELRLNAQNRLISELQKIYILTNSMDWKLEYNNKIIGGEKDLNDLKF